MSVIDEIRATMRSYDRADSRRPDYDVEANSKATRLLFEPGKTIPWLRYLLAEVERLENERVQSIKDLDSYR